MDKPIVVSASHPSHGGPAEYRLTPMIPKRRYLSYLRERWWLPLICVAAASGAMVAYETLRGETYTSFAQLYVNGQMQVSMNLGSFFAEESQTFLGTQVELLKSGRLQSEAFVRVGYVPKPGEDSPVRVEVTQPLKTSILILRATSADAQLAQGFLQALVDEYLKYKKETRLSTSEDVVLSLTDELTKKGAELAIEQGRWTEFQKTNNVAVLEEEGKSAGLYLADLNLQLARLRLQRDLLLSGLRGGQLVGGTAGVTSGDGKATGGAVESGGGDPVSPRQAPGSNDMVALKTARLELAIARSELASAERPPEHPANRKLVDDINRLERSVAVLEQQQAEQIQGELREVEMRIAAVDASLPNWEKRVLDINARLSESQRLKNNILREQGYYDRLLATLQTADLSRNVQQEQFSVLQPATAAAVTKRYLSVRIALALVAGLMLGAGLAFIWYLLDDRFVSVRDVHDQFGEKVIGLIPGIKVRAARVAESLLQPADPRQAYAESFRHLRSALLLGRRGADHPRTIVVTGVRQGEGKTTVAANLAIILARSDFRVALVDADASGRGAHEFFGAENRSGLREYLHQGSPLAEVLQSLPENRMKLLSRGVSEAPSDGVFLQSRIERLMNELRVAHDFVIIDAPPVIERDDAALLAACADLVLVVARPFFTSSHAMCRTVELLHQRQVRQLAFVWNRARKDDLAGHSAGDRAPAYGGSGLPA